jgi:CRP/FNR family cyclic AMP-dependent transcriptional regulator
MKLPVETLQQVHTMLNTVPFLKTLRQSEIESLAHSLNLRHFAKGETIIRQGESGRLFHLIFKGKVEVSRKKFFGKKILATLGPGEFFGEISLIDNTPRTATVVGLEDGEMFTLSRDSFNEVLLKNPQIATILREISRARQQSNRQVE